MTTVTYHVGEVGPRRCSARPGNCPVALAEPNNQTHYPTMMEAQTVYEKKLQLQYGSTFTAKRTRHVKTWTKRDTAGTANFLNTASIPFDRLNKRRHEAPTRMRGTGPNRSRPGRSQYPRSRPRRRRGNWLTKSLRKLTRPRTIKKLLLMKYWFPDIHSKKWR